MRRYCAENRLNRLGTLTYAPPFEFDPNEVRRDVAEFFRRLRERVGRPFPYVWVPELHADGERYHVHFAVGRYIPRGWIEQAWAYRGLVHIKLLGDLPVGSGTLGEARQAGRYLAKYIGKDLGDSGGLHRYDLGQGFQPQRDAFIGRTAEEALGLAVGAMGAPPSLVWRSSDEAQWAGPPAIWAQWS